MADDTGGNADFNIVGEVQLHGADQARVREVYDRLLADQRRYNQQSYEEAEEVFQRIRRLTKREYDWLKTTFKENARARSDALKAEMQAERIAAKEREQLRQRESTRLAQQRHHRNQIERDDNRHQNHLLLTAQKQAEKERLQAQKAADAQALRAARQADKESLQAQKAAASLALAEQKRAHQRAAIRQAGEWKRRLQEQKAADQQRLVALRAAEARTTNAEKAAQRERLVRLKAEEDRRTAAEAAGHKERLAREEAALARRVARHKAFYSVLRSVAEKGGRDLLSATERFLSRIFSRQQSNEARGLSLMRRGEERRQGILRSSYADQERIVTRSLIRQQGAIAGFQQSTSRGLIGSFMRVRTLLLGAGGFLTARALFGPVADFEQTRIAFSGLLRGMARTEPVLRNLRQFAQESPFEFSQLADSARQLLGIGFDSRRIIPILRDIGGAAATLGAGEEDIQGVVRALGQMIGQGRANAEDINQITERFVGFNARAAIAAHLGISVGEAMDRMREGLIPADVAVEGILEGMRNMSGAEDALERQSRTLNGRISTLKDILFDLQVTALAPLTRHFADLVGVINELLLNLKQGEGVWSVVRSGLLGIAIGLGAIFAARGAVQVLQLLRIAILGLLTPMGAITFTAAALGATLTILARHVPQVGDAFSAAASVIGDSWGRITDSIGALLRGDFSGFAEGIGGVATDVRAALQPAIDFISDAISRAFDAVAPVVVDAWNNIFDRVAEFIRGGGLGRVRDALLETIQSILERIPGGLATVLGGAGAGLLILFGPFGPIGGAIIAGVAALGVIFRNRIGEIVGDLPMLLLTGLNRLGQFLGGPVVRAIFSEASIKIIGVVAAVIAASAGSFLLGFIDGLKRSLPDAVRALQNVLHDLLTSAVEAVADIPILGEAIEFLRIPIEGILPTIEVFLRLVERIPTPVIAAGIAIFGLVKAWKALQTTALASKISSAFTWVTALPGRLTAFGQGLQQTAETIRSTNATFANIGGGTQRLSRTATAMSGVGAATSALGQALPIVGAGLVVGLGLWEQHRQKQEQARQEAKELADQLLKAGAAARDVITDRVLSDNEALVSSLNRIDVEAADMTDAILAGDEAVTQLSEAVRQQALNETGSLIFSDFEADRVRRAADEVERAAVIAVESAAAEGRLTDAQRERLDLIRSGEVDQAEAVRIIAELGSVTQVAADAADEHAERVRDYAREASEAADTTDDFREAILRLTGGALDIREARRAVRDAMNEIRSQFREGVGLRGLSDEIDAAIEQIIGLHSALTDAGREDEAAAAFAFLREGLIQQLEQIMGNRQAAEDYIDALLPEEGEIASDIRENVLRPLRQSQRELAGMIRAAGRVGITDEERERIIDNFQEAAEAAREEIEGTPAELTWRIHIEDVRWDETVAAYERMFRRGQIDVGINLTGPPPGGAGRGAGFLAGAQGIAGPAGAGGDTGLLPTREAVQGNVDVLVQLVATIGPRILEASMPGLQSWQESVTGVFTAIFKRFTAWIRMMADTAKAGGKGIVDSLAGSLQAGVTEIGRIVGNYTAELAKALNPILRAIGSEPIEVRAFARGEFMPRIAEGSQGPQVHVFNEAGRHGEAYIPFDPAYRHRARDIAEQSTRRLGGRIQWFQEGGITAPVQNVTGDWQGLHPEFARRLSIWATGLGDVFHIVSGFRTYAEQVAAWQRYQSGQGARAAFPGSSLHEFGLAADGPHWGNRGPGRYSLVYPMSDEPWHVQPVEGRGLGDVASFMPMPTPPEVDQKGWIARAARAVMNYLYEKATTWAGGQGLSAPAIGAFQVPANIMAGIRQAMAIVGVPSTWLGPLLTLIERESGFNPRAYNGILGASGLMQTIPSTFAAYALPGYGNIFGIIDNVIAGLRYILSRYGSIFNVGQATAPHPTAGYRMGGFIHADGAYQLHAGEFVVPAGLVRDLGGNSLSVADLRRALNPDDGMGRNTPLIGELKVESNASDPEAVGVIVGSRLRDVVSSVNMGG